MRRRILGLALLSTLAVATAFAAPPLEVEADFLLEEGREEVRVGEPFSFVVVAKHAPGGVALLPSPLELGDAVAERVTARRHERTTEGGVQTDRYVLELLAFERGLVTIPAIPLALGSTTAETAPMEISIASGFEGEALEAMSSTQAEALQALETLAAQNGAPLAVMVDDWTLLWVIGAVLLLVVALLVARGIARRRRENVPAPPPPPPRPAHELAEEALARLRSSDYLVRGEHKAFYTELSAIMRAYAGGRWSFDSLDLTIDELVEILRQRRTDGLDLPKMTHLLRLADEVKFAKFAPSADDGAQHLDDAAELVAQTRPRERTEAS